MSNSELTRRQFIEMAGAAATSAKLRFMGLDAVPSAKEDEGARLTIPFNRNWRFMRQASPGSAVEAQFIGAEKPGYDDSSWPFVWLPHSWDLSPDNPFSTRVPLW
jgi:hypothetical protein